MGTPKSWKTVEIAQEVARGFTQEHVETLIAAITSIKDYAYIIHDQDETRPHGHLMIRFKDSYPTAQLIKTANASGIQIAPTGEQLNKCHKWSSAVAYLTHKNAPEKHQYPEEAVHTNIPPEQYHAMIKQATSPIKDARLCEILDLVDNGTLAEYNLNEHITQDEYVKYKKDLNSAFEYQSMAHRQGDRKMDVIYLWGRPGSGKTTVAKVLGKSIADKHGVYISSGGKYPFDDYRGEAVIILDDFRPDSISFADVLKLLDNNTASMVHARYLNKNLWRVRAVILTCTLSFDQWCGILSSEHPNEPLDQFRRRVSVVYQVKGHKGDTFEVYLKEQDTTMYIEAPITVEQRNLNPLAKIAKAIEVNPPAPTREELKRQAQEEVNRTYQEKLKLKEIDTDTEDLPF